MGTSRAYEARGRDDAIRVAPPRSAVSGGSSNFRAAIRCSAEGRRMLDDIAAPHGRSALGTVAYLTRNWKFESSPLQRRVCELSVPERRAPPEAL